MTYTGAKGTYNKWGSDINTVDFLYDLCTCINF